MVAEGVGIGYAPADERINDRLCAFVKRRLGADINIVAREHNKVGLCVIQHIVHKRYHLAFRTCIVLTVGKNHYLEFSVAVELQFTVLCGR